MRDSDVDRSHYGSLGMTPDEMLVRLLNAPNTSFRDELRFVKSIVRFNRLDRPVSDSAVLRQVAKRLNLKFHKPDLDLIRFVRAYQEHLGERT